MRKIQLIAKHTSLDIKFILMSDDTQYYVFCGHLQMKHGKYKFYIFIN